MMYRIIKPIWLNSRVYKPGQENDLYLSKKQQKRYLRRGDIRMLGQPVPEGSKGVQGVTGYEVPGETGNTGMPGPVGSYSEDDLHDLTVDELRDMARERDIPYSGLRKNELIQALNEG